MKVEEVVGRYVDVSGTRTYFESQGEGVPIICVHTAGCDGRVYRHVLPELAKAGLHAVALDLPGHGKSYPVGWKATTRIHDYAEFVMAFAAELELGRPIILGCSIGADITIDLAVHHSGQLRACIALEGAARTPTYGDVSRFVESHAGIGWEAIAEMGAPSSFQASCPPELLDEIRWIQKSAGQNVRASDLVAWGTHDVLAQMSQVAIPLLIGVGSADYQVPEHLVDETVAASPQAKKVLLTDLGHFPMFEDAGTVAGVILGFLRENAII
jgi:pimeloyl-ACP methyl ester carboxylesterase